MLQKCYALCFDLHGQLVWKSVADRFLFVIFTFVISNHDQKYSIFPSYFFEKKSCVNLVISCTLCSDFFTNKLFFVCPQVARGLVYTIGLELDNEQISYITSNIFTLTVFKFAQYYFSRTPRCANLSTARINIRANWSNFSNFEILYVWSYMSYLWIGIICVRCISNLTQDMRL